MTQKYVFNYLIPAVGTLLEQITGITVYDGMAPDTATGTFIVLGERSYVQGQDKSGFTGDAFLMVDCNVRGNNLGFKTSQELAEEVMERLNSDANPDLSPDFQVAGTKIVSTNDLGDMNDTTKVFRTAIRYSFKISQLQ